MLHRATSMCTVLAGLNGMETCTLHVPITQQYIYKNSPRCLLVDVSPLVLSDSHCTEPIPYVELRASLEGEITCAEGLNNSVPQCQRNTHWYEQPVKTSSGLTGQTMECWLPLVHASCMPVQLHRQSHIRATHAHCWLRSWFGNQLD